MGLDGVYFFFLFDFFSLRFRAYFPSVCDSSASTSSASSLLLLLLVSLDILDKKLVIDLTYIIRPVGVELI